MRAANCCGDTVASEQPDAIEVRDREGVYCHAWSSASVLSSACLRVGDGAERVAAGACGDGGGGVALARSIGGTYADGTYAPGGRRPALTHA